MTKLWPTIIRCNKVSTNGPLGSYMTTYIFVCCTNFKNQNFEPNYIDLIRKKYNYKLKLVWLLQVTKYHFAIAISNNDNNK